MLRRRHERVWEFPRSHYARQYENRLAAVHRRRPSRPTDLAGEAFGSQMEPLLSDALQRIPSKDVVLRCQGTIRAGQEFDAPPLVLKAEQQGVSTALT